MMPSALRPLVVPFASARKGSARMHIASSGLHGSCEVRKQSIVIHGSCERGKMLEEIHTLGLLPVPV